MFGAFPDLPYEVRLERLRAHHIALWDVCATAIRPGSLDHRIDASSVVATDFAAFFAAHPALRRICFNGRHAAELFRRKVKTPLPPGVGCRQLPSTSPAHAAMRPADKLALWREALVEA